MAHMTPDAIKKHLQERLSDDLVTIAGSCLPCAEGLPSMGKLASHLSTALESKLSVTDAVLWKKIRPLSAFQGLKAVLQAMQPTAPPEAAISAMIGAVIPDSATRDVWKEWGSRPSDVKAISLTVDVLRSQTRVKSC